MMSASAPNVRRANGFGTKLHGQGLRACPSAARRLPRRFFNRRISRFAADVTPRRWCWAEALQRRTEAGP